MEIRKISQIDLQIAKKLRHYRRLSAISQSELAKLTGLSSQQIQKYERGQNRISSSKLFEFSQVLKKPISVFFEDLESVKKSGKISFVSENHLIDLSKKDKEQLAPVIKAFKNLEDESLKKNIVNLLSSISKGQKKAKKKPKKRVKTDQGLNPSFYKTNI